MKQNGTPITRRDFVRQVGLGVAGVGAFPALPFERTESAPRMRRVVVMSDIHVGRRADGLDGAGWLSCGFDDLERNLEPIDYGMTLGDITHHGDRASLTKYLEMRDRSAIPRWFELAGNHEYWGRGIRHYQSLVGPADPYCVVDGNIAWVLLSDERNHPAGSITNSSYRWLSETMERHRDKIIVFCSHQPPANTVRRSDQDMFCLHPRDKVRDLFSRLPIALSLSGHEHHRPYSKGNIARKGGTTFINVASMTHAYGTGSSASLVLELEEGATEAVARRRNHDRARFSTDFEVRIPLGKRIELASDVEISSAG
jgi:predicted phosphodiesterase